MVDPTIMCRQHLLGEHLELHMFVGTIKRGTSVTGYVNNNLLDSAQIKARHEALVDEMEKRGYSHFSPLAYKDELRAGSVDSKLALRELLRRCPACRSLHRKVRKATQPKGKKQ